jgi:hypothetical protein
MGVFFYYKKEKNTNGCFCCSWGGSQEIAMPIPCLQKQISSFAGFGLVETPPNFEAQTRNPRGGVLKHLLYLIKGEKMLTYQGKLDSNEECVGTLRSKVNGKYLVCHALVAFVFGHANHC